MVFKVYRSHPPISLSYKFIWKKILGGPGIIVYLELECGDCHNFRCFTCYRSYIIDFLIHNSLIGALNLFKHEKLFGESKKSEIILQSKQFTTKRHMRRL